MIDRETLRGLCTNRRPDPDAIADMEAGLCAFCRHPITLADGSLDFFMFRDGELHYPDRNEDGSGVPVSAFTHAGCSPDVGWSTPITSVGDIYAKHGLHEHVSGKIWCCPTYEFGIRVGEDVRAALLSGPIDADAKPRRRQSRVNPTPKMRALIFERDVFKCRRCGHGPPESKIVVDHVVAVALGGKTVLSNLQTLCVACNAGKAARPHAAHDATASAIEVGR